ncbi:MAG: hypothetical protein EOP45_19590 [Sphingobacteriaceae bacterium]|nr:MAG: hypothetical protein EOP45_19590 [Sphingobacteriaceae bacterium]
MSNSPYTGQATKHPMQHIPPHDLLGKQAKDLFYELKRTEAILEKSQVIGQQSYQGIIFHSPSLEAKKLLCSKMDISLKYYDYLIDNLGLESFKEQACNFIVNMQDFITYYLPFLTIYPFNELRIEGLIRVYSHMASYEPLINNLPQLKKTVGKILVHDNNCVEALSQHIKNVALLKGYSYKHEAPLIKDSFEEGLDEYY